MEKLLVLMLIVAILWSFLSVTIIWINVFTSFRKNFSSKFHIGQRVYFIHGSEIINDVVAEVTMTDSFIKGRSETYKLKNYRGDVDTFKDDIFESKEELIKSLL